MNTKRRRRKPIYMSEIKQGIEKARQINRGLMPTVAEVAKVLGTAPGTLYARLAVFRRAGEKPEKWGFALSNGRKRGRKPAAPAPEPQPRPAPEPRLITYVNNAGVERTVQTDADKLSDTVGGLLSERSPAQPTTIRVWKPVRVKIITRYEEES